MTIRLKLSPFTVDENQLFILITTFVLKQSGAKIQGQPPRCAIFFKQNYSYKALKIIASLR